MFSYYGSKSKIVDYYSPPKYDNIIEPFAGSARYSLKYWEKDILLIDKYEVIVKIWKWLQKCSPNDILKLPSIKKGIDLRTLNLIDEERWLIGFNIGAGNTYPLNFAGNFNHWENNKKKIAKQLYKIKHWKIYQDDYKNLKNKPAVWFIDPPYQIGGHKYKYSDINYFELKNWCESRKGQIIVCENTKANWLPFKPMIKMNGCQTITTEAIWSNYKTNYDSIQQSLQF